ncbi:MAG: biotin transporter BioY [Firmicutes bacterium]|nr:biotin transporter BioY [Bacillota bacterium]
MLISLRNHRFTKGGIIVEAIRLLRQCREKAGARFAALAFPGKLGLAFCFAAFIGLAAQIRIPLPWTPVPITGQTFAVLVTGALLGAGWGAVGTGLYLVAGALGLPWFAGWTGGFHLLTGATGGYLLGFIPAAVFVGYAIERFPRARSMAGLLGVMTVADFLFIHGPGLLVLSLVSGVYDPTKLLWMGTFPFIPGDMTKIAAASVLCRCLLPEENR